MATTNPNNNSDLPEIYSEVYIRTSFNFIVSGIIMAEDISGAKVHLDTIPTRRDQHKQRGHPD
jgi:hypothetical protein